MSPEQKNRCNEHKVRAELLKLSKTLTILTPDIRSSWYQALSESVFSKDWFQKLSDFVSQERDSATIYPSPTEVWSWTQHVPISSVKVVILGQDPYHGPGQAHGLCFSVKPGVAPPPSLPPPFPSNLRPDSAPVSAGSVSPKPLLLHLGCRFRFR